MTIRAKVQVHEHHVAQYGKDAPTQKRVVARPVYPRDGEIGEDQKFHEATPVGLIDLTMKNDVADRFPIGSQFYVDFTPVTEGAPIE